MTALMFCMSIAGAAALGISGAIAQSGGIASIVMVFFVAILTKRSLDLLMAVSIDTEGVNGSYEQLGFIAMGVGGKVAVFVSKYLYTFFLLLVHIKVVKDNFPSAMQGIVGPEYEYLFANKDVVTFITSLLVVFPMCLLRTMGLVELTSVAKIGTAMIITVFIVYFYINMSGAKVLRQESVYEDWLEVKPGVLPSLGTFVFFFVAHNCAHISYETLREDIRDMKHWKQVTTIEVLLCMALCLCLGFSVYMTFWDDTTSIMLQLYPVTMALNIVKVLVCIFSVFTIPMNFFAAREMIIISFPSLPPIVDENGSRRPSEWWLQAERQLIGPLHFALSLFKWFIVTMLAILAPSLNDILNVGGCICGTMIGFILPSLFWFRLKGYSHEALFMLVVGTMVGTVGTFFAVKTTLQHMGILSS